MWLNICFHISTLLFIVKHTLNKKMMLNSFWMFLENFREKEIAKMHYNNLFTHRAGFVRIYCPFPHFSLYANPVIHFQALKLDFNDAMKGHQCDILNVEKGHINMLLQ